MELTDIAYARCKACDSRFYPAWREEHQEFEELCSTCIKEAFMLHYYSSEDEEFLQALVSEYTEEDPDYET